MGAPNFYRSGLVSLLFVSLCVSSLANADYNRFCPDKTSQIQVDSTFYTVACDTSYISPAPKKVREGASPEDCARLCTAEPAYHAIVWYLGNCWQSDKTDAVSFRVPGAVLLTPGEKHDHATGTSEEQKQCLAEKEQLAQKNDQCGRSLEQCETEKSSISAAKTTCENSLEAANKEIARLSNQQTVTDRFVPTEKDDGLEIVVGGKRWKIYYSKLNDPGAWDVGTLSQPSYMACMELCASKPTCVRTAWVNNYAGANTCWMRSYGQNTVQTITRGWTSTHLIAPA
ncbi:hypothetical protein KXV74_009466 [Aspergillus fumigatus]|uniref:Apple domain-containing protein n=1 Tax=Aspergillus fumigatus (strain ATCC MYA-4609 / CBS 101355 / FGSC A1100 / Af293) TaxID=330879 RepID=Q4WIW8_ASPFU|nr:hypothetical protein AFUA_2G00390 [Aspergillus fumigatus Af293]EAL87137.1 hypothetical protein AFUA_2G00390 [Aspergillus fumigatus Af293]KAH1437946.1 hypothetical protein KXX32_000106 [Aspergillus fumigatus]KAH2171529.1 hypothetical protein KXV74_009466 [Aspergillus fumigatus]